MKGDEPAPQSLKVAVLIISMSDKGASAERMLDAIRRELPNATPQDVRDGLAVAMTGNVALADISNDRDKPS